MEKRTMGSLMSALRKSKGMTQQDVADILGVSNKTVSKWECDDGCPDISTLPAIAELYGITVDELIRGEVRNESTPMEFIREAKPRTVNHLLNKSKRKYMNMSLISLVLLLFSSTFLIVQNMWILTEAVFIAISAVTLSAMAASMIILYISTSQFIFNLKDNELVETKDIVNGYTTVKWWTFANLSALILTVILFISAVFIKLNEAKSPAAICFMYFFLSLILLIVLSLSFEKKIQKLTSDTSTKLNNKKFFIGLIAVFVAVFSVFYGAKAVYNELSYETFQLQNEQQKEQIDDFMHAGKYIVLNKTQLDGEPIYKSLPEEYDPDLALTVVFRETPVNVEDETSDEIWKRYACKTVMSGMCYSDEEYGGAINYMTIVFSNQNYKESFKKNYCIKDSEYFNGLDLAKLCEANEINYTGKDSLTMKYRDFYVSMDDARFVCIVLALGADIAYALVFFICFQHSKSKRKRITDDE